MVVGELFLFVFPLPWTVACSLVLLDPRKKRVADSTEYPDLHSAV
jgi:hypothetical protein